MTRGGAREADTGPVPIKVGHNAVGRTPQRHWPPHTSEAGHRDTISFGAGDGTGRDDREWKLAALRLQLRLLAAQNLDTLNAVLLGPVVEVALREVLRGAEVVLDQGLADDVTAVLRLAHVRSGRQGDEDREQSNECESEARHDQ
eukprot:CAMPEP_0174831356 /NCGR_PEP_ID=MMETSP1114-20130205/3043_1 /TAXON_ID=312471 /ORGANISM="Neobodo designis, Strain CCAP 1951/1" /LENGTH=144 /DNA_ID=CAMNT_0016065179 /DNA_START=61 /DNA_END=495 /DNA_ORIENTATION=-